MSNHNVLKGIACPTCKWEDSFIISGTTAVKFQDDGMDETPDVEFTDQDTCSCPRCGLMGTVGQFSGKHPIEVFREVTEAFGLVQISEEEDDSFAVTIEGKHGHRWEVSLELDLQGLHILANGGRRPADRDGLGLTLWEMSQARLTAEEHRPRPLPRDLDSLVNELTTALEDLRATRNADGSDRIDLDHDTVFDAVDAADKAIERGNEYLRAPKKA